MAPEMPVSKEADFWNLNYVMRVSAHRTSSCCSIYTVVSDGKKSPLNLGPLKNGKREAADVTEAINAARKLCQKHTQGNDGPFILVCGTEFKKGFTLKEFHNKVTLRSMSLTPKVHCQARPCFDVGKEVMIMYLEDGRLTVKCADTRASNMPHGLSTPGGETKDCFREILEIGCGKNFHLIYGSKQNDPPFMTETLKDDFGHNYRVEIIKLHEDEDEINQIALKSQSKCRYLQERKAMVYLRRAIERGEAKLGIGSVSRTFDRSSNYKGTVLVGYEFDNFGAVFQGLRYVGESTVRMKFEDLVTQAGRSMIAVDGRVYPELADHEFIASFIEK